MTENERLSALIESAIARVNQDEIDRPELPEIPMHKPYGKYCDHSVLRAYTKSEIISAFCKEAREYGAAAVSVNPIHIPLVKKELEGSGVNTGASVGFPLGATTPAVKAFETAEAIANGAEEIDMVSNIGALRDKNYELYLKDIQGVVAAAKGAPVKVIIETCYLTREEKIAATALAQEGGATYIKTSTGMGTRGARVADVILMRRTVEDKVMIKAASDVTCREDADAMIKAGAQRLGISRLIAIVTDEKDAHCASMDNKPAPLPKE